MNFYFFRIVIFLMTLTEYKRRARRHSIWNKNCHYSTRPNSMDSQSKGDNYPLQRRQKELPRYSHQKYHEQEVYGTKDVNDFYSLKQFSSAKYYCLWCLVPYWYYKCLLCVNIQDLLSLGLRHIQCRVGSDPIWCGVAKLKCQIRKRDMKQVLSLNILQSWNVKVKILNDM